jgi:hypothetical protein
MGHGLRRLTQAHHGKLPVDIPEGKIRPVVPIVVAKFATESNIVVRNHIPVLKHWSEYTNCRCFLHRQDLGWSRSRIPVLRWYCKL